MGALTLVAAGRTDVGLLRENNEDSYLVGPSILVVADGVGGAVAGELASQTVVNVFADLPLFDEGHIYDALGAATSRATQAVADLVVSHPDLAGMGTTLTAAAWKGGDVIVAQVGDSRAYYLPVGGERALTQITRDDSFVQYLVDTGRITEEQAAVHPRRNVILQAVDGSPVTPSFTTMSLVEGDRYLLCSDGLSDYVERSLLEAAMRDGGSRESTADALIDLALAAGAPDNVTVIVADVVAI